ncbi:ABC transporter substrate-binding protein [Clostridium sp. MB40-C1]|uniref:ABC transporter substrate-binding protein n=1 Tax=Clostridium sp. MB40-C1 TaxID=3070996 RepID=UPI0027E083F0|nr:ABC transporter substrate-binding protein [Clostridium sp. MB40-C1]WMJ80136.1 ABC transporter substrate-binding protein [Clostridium sp. MB40-C1]
MIKNKKFKAIIFSMILCLAAGFTGCGKKAEAPSADNKQKVENKSEGGEVDRIKKSGKLVLGTCADYPPYEFHKKVNGKDEIIGFDIEIAKEIAKDLGVKLEIKDMGFDGLIPSLQTGKVDLLISGMTPDEKRKKEVDFTKLYYKAEQAIMIRTADKDKFKSLDDFTGKKIGAQKASIQDEIAKKQIKNASIVSLSKVTDLTLSLKTKRCDAIVVEGPVAKSYAAKNSDIMVANVKVDNIGEGAAIAVKKGSNDLVELMNKTIDKLTSEGKIDAFVIKANEMVE